MKLIVTIHGIRTANTNRWDERFQKLVKEELSHHNYKVIIYDYAYFNILQFGNRLSRNRAISDFYEFYEKNCVPENPPSVVAHSFGTYILFKTLNKHKHIKFDKIIFCGSILSSKINWRKILELGQFNTLYNHHGWNEWFLLGSKVITMSRYCGHAGKIGFKDIPPKFIGRIVNEDYNYNHSDYFLKSGMKANWLKYFYNQEQNFGLNKNILRDVVVRRIYKNLNEGKNELSIISQNIHVRIDADGNYFTKVIFETVNNSKNNVNTFRYAVTADGSDKIDDMGFEVFSEGLERLSMTVLNDSTQFKSVEIHFNRSVRPGESIKFRIYNSWTNTINLKGDTDHWIAKSIKYINVSLNFPCELINPRIFTVKDSKLSNSYELQCSTEQNNTRTYKFKYENNEETDGLVFYFDNTRDIIKSKKIQKQNFVLKQNKKIEWTISPCMNADIRSVYNLESKIEGDKAASEATLIQRRLMFNDGFLVIKNERSGQIIGYLQSIVWNEKPFSTFNQISNFPLHYNINGSSLYIIFIAVRKKFRRNKLGSMLLGKIEDVAKAYGVNDITLVTKSNLIEFYKSNGYSFEKKLPEFLPNREYESFLMRKKLK